MVPVFVSVPTKSHPPPGSVLMEILRMSDQRSSRRSMSVSRATAAVISIRFRGTEARVAPQKRPESASTLRLVRVPGKNHPEIVCMSFW